MARTRELKIRVAGDAGDATKALDKVGDAATDAGKDLDKLGTDAKDAEQGLDQTEQSADQAGRSLLGFGRDAVTAGRDVAAGMALFEGAQALGEQFSGAFTQGLQIEQAQTKLRVQLGGMSPLSESAGKAAGSLYSQGFGDSLGTVNEAMRQVIQGGLVMEDASVGQMEAITGAVLTTAQAFDQDLGATTRAVGQMLRTGLADSATEALDILTRGFQQGGDKAQDLLDTFNEYSTQFRKLGLDGTAAMGLITQGLQAGARDADIVADAIKEFSIRAVDGSTLTAESFRALGLDAKQMAAQIAAGGPAAEEGLGTVLDRLRAVEDPAKRAQIAVGLFGTQAEDLGAALFALDPSSAVTSMGEVEGAARKAGDELRDTGQTKMLAFQRGAEQAFASLINAPGIVGTASSAIGGLGAAVLPIGGDLGGLALALGGLKNVAPGIAGPIGSVAKKFGGLGLTALKAAGNVTMAGLRMAGSAAATTAKVVGQIAVQVGRWVFLGVQSLIQAARVALAWIISMGPIAIVIAAVIGLVALIIANWDKIRAFILTVWEKIKDAFTVVKNWIGARIADVVGFFRALPGKVVGFLVRVNLFIREKFLDAVDFVRGLWDGLVNFLRKLPGRVAGFFRSIGNTIKNTFRNAINRVIGWWNSISFTLPTIRIPAIDVGPIKTPAFTVGGQTYRVPQIPRLAGGTANVPEDMLAMLHRGEAVLPRPMAERFRGGGDTIIIDQRGALVPGGAEMQRVVVNALKEAGRKGTKVAIRGRRL